jgi:hypothetical protein
MINIRRSEERGGGNHGWLNTHHTFSFNTYYDPKFMGFRSLRVINEDWVAAGQGFPTHPHQNMEIITYILEGEIEHKDSLGPGSIIRPGDGQREPVKDEGGAFAADLDRAGPCRAQTQLRAERISGDGKAEQAAFNRFSKWRGRFGNDTSRRQALRIFVGAGQRGLPPDLEGTLCLAAGCEGRGRTEWEAAQSGRRSGSERRIKADD